jgi:serine/threonine-protein kinase
MSVGDDDTVAGSQPTTQDGALADTEVVAGRYKIVRWLGGGGMGRVYEALDTELGERVALKMLRGGLSDDAIERFRREVRLTRRIVHRNVARMFDIGEHGGDKFLTMELVDGDPLTRLIGARILWVRLESIARQLCAGLGAAHAAGVVHRDLKPDNVLLERGTERAVITDFGIARSGDDAGVTQVGAIVGTPRYMAPEQLAGRDVDARADIFALGVMLFELATGTRPWAGDNAIAIAVAQATSAPRTIDPGQELPVAFPAIVAACLQIDPARRPNSAEAIDDAIVSGDVAALERATVAGVLRAPPTASMAPGALKPDRPSTPLARISVPAVPTQAEPTSLAVLPIACAPGDEYLADGVLEDLTDVLSTTPGLRVRPAGVVRSHTSPDPREVGHALQVDHVVAATLRRTPAGLRLAARVIGVADGFQIWAHKIDCSEAEILAASEKLVEGIAGALSARAAVPTRPTDARAVDLYLRARAEQRRFWGTHLQTAADLLAQAAEYAPTSPPILGALAHANVQVWVLRGLPELAAKARASLERGLATGHGEAYIASAQYHFNIGDFERAGRDLGIALVRAPMSAPAHELAANILVEIEGGTTGRQHYEAALGLDPGRAKILNYMLARLDALEGSFGAADARVVGLLADTDPAIVQLGHIMQARLAAWRGRREEMLAAATRFSPPFGPRAEQLTEQIKKGIMSGELDLEMWRDYWSGFVGESDRPFRQQLYGMQILTELLLMIDKPDPALDTLEAAARTGLLDLFWIERCPVFAPVATNRRLLRVRDLVADRANRVLAAFRSAGA